jgi:hypothetical protein
MWKNQGTKAMTYSLTCFFLTAMAFFCNLSHGDANTTSVYQLTHPPPPVRIKYAINVAEMWCTQNGFDMVSSFSVARLQRLFNAAADIVGETTKGARNALIEFLRGPDGVEYDRQLFEKFESIRKNQT